MAEEQISLLKRELDETEKSLSRANHLLQEDVLYQRTGLLERQRFFLLNSLEWAMAVLDGYEPPLDDEPLARYEREHEEARYVIELMSKEIKKEAEKMADDTTNCPNECVHLSMDDFKCSADAAELKTDCPLQAMPNWCETCRVFDECPVEAKKTKPGLVECNQYIPNDLAIDALNIKHERGELLVVLQNLMDPVQRRHREASRWNEDHARHLLKRLEEKQESLDKAREILKKLEEENG